MLDDGECDGNADARAAFEKPIFMLKATSTASCNPAPVPDKPVTCINGYLASKHEAKQVGNNYFIRLLARSFSLSWSPAQTDSESRSCWRTGEVGPFLLPRGHKQFSALVSSARSTKDGTQNNTQAHLFVASRGRDRLVSKRKKICVKAPK